MMIYSLLLGLDGVILALQLLQFAVTVTGELPVRSYLSHAFTWLDTRALIIPRKSLPDVASALGTTPDALHAANQQVAGETTAVLSALASEYLNEHGIK